MWKFYTLTWVYLNSTYLQNQIDQSVLNLTEPQIRYTIHKTLSQWEVATNLNFKEEGHNTQADIKIAFIKGDHADGHSFDGKSGVLAHAFKPSHPFKGTIHLDLDEDWFEDKLESVMLHEIGHVLGLDHNNDKNSVMYAGYTGVTTLLEDDILSIRRKYGQRRYRPISSLLVYDRETNELRFKISSIDFKTLLSYPND
jgi:predicted Zn-dependent protease